LVFCGDEDTLTGFMDLPDCLLALVAARAPESAMTWLRTALATLSLQSFGPAFASAARRFGHAPLALTALERAELARSSQPPTLGSVLEVMPLSGLVRSLLLLGAVRLVPEDGQVSFVARTFDTADSFERAAVLRSLGGLPDPARFVDVAVHACRTHVQDVFEAIACENPYPSQYFPDPAFQQLVLKCFFTEVPVRRVEGLASRLNAELARMALAYASERRAAGRSVPPDLELVTGIHAANSGSVPS
jgi:hypothetical protein